MYTNNVVTRDDKYCPPKDSKNNVGNPMCDSVETQKSEGNVRITAWYCCTEQRCNENDSLVVELVKGELGMFVEL